MTAPALRLREICQGYPGSIVNDAIRRALAAEISDERECAVLAALIQHWLGNLRDAPCPPLNHAFVEQVRRNLNAQAH